MSAPTQPWLRLAYAWGQAVAAYFRWAVPTHHIRVLGDRPPGAVIWAMWHEANLLGLAAYPRLSLARACQSLVPPGVVGAVARGWVEATGLTAAPLSKDGARNPRAALKQLALALQNEQDVMVAVDGPHGPARHVWPGALWLARFTGCPIIPVGAAAWPVWRLPRWDQQMIPLPGAQATFVLGAPLFVNRAADIDEALRARLAEALNASFQQAQVLLAQRPAHNFR